MSAVTFHGVTFTSIRYEHTELYSPVCVQLLDVTTNAPPLGTINSVVERQVDGGRFEPTGVEPTVTPGGLFTVPGLGRDSDAQQPPLAYRIRFEAEFYQPVFSDNVPFLLFPYNDDEPPLSIASVSILRLQPSITYVARSELPLLRGTLLSSATHEPLSRVRVTKSEQEYVFSDEQGRFVLPMQWVHPELPAPRLLPAVMFPQPLQPDQIELFHDAQPSVGRALYTVDLERDRHELLKLLIP